MYIVPTRKSCSQIYCLTISPSLFLHSWSAAERHVLSETGEIFLRKVLQVDTHSKRGDPTEPKIMVSVMCIVMIITFIGISCVFRIQFFLWWIVDEDVLTLNDRAILLHSWGVCMIGLLLSNPFCTNMIALTLSIHTTMECLGTVNRSIVGT